MQKFTQLNVSWTESKFSLWTLGFSPWFLFSDVPHHLQTFHSPCQLWVSMQLHFQVSAWAKTLLKMVTYRFISRVLLTAFSKICTNKPQHLIYITTDYTLQEKKWHIMQILQRKTQNKSENTGDWYRSEQFWVFWNKLQLFSSDLNPETMKINFYITDQENL